MLCTWTGHHYDENDNETTHLTGGVVTPDCCESVQSTFAIHLAYGWGDLDEKIFDKATPTWRLSVPMDLLQSAGRAGQSLSRPAPTVCPFCATPLPTIIRRPNPPGKTHRPSDDGDYCNVCNERSRCCMCLFPEAAWMPVTEISAGGADGAS